MKAMNILAAAFFALMPAAALAMCGGHGETANVCEAGYEWDDTAQTCVEIVAS